MYLRIAQLRRCACSFVLGVIVMMSSTLLTPPGPTLFSNLYNYPPYAVYFIIAWNSQTKTKTKTKTTWPGSNGHMFTAGFANAWKQPELMMPKSGWPLELLVLLVLLVLPLVFVVSAVLVHPKLHFTHRHGHLSNSLEYLPAKAIPYPTTRMHYLRLA
ncbi:hypothetical protein F5Y07DRAFT_248580 [Xylaria sp. FL0933]|nr:hypothetical protein F5Y07DRAFT_248580 [Xylaria sp. FL0933]